MNVVKQYLLVFYSILFKYFLFNPLKSKNMKKQTWLISRLAQLSLVLLLLTHRSVAQPLPILPAATPTISDMTNGVITAPTTPDWVNADMYNYTNSFGTGHLLAIAYDDLSTNTVYAFVYDDRTGNMTPPLTINNSRHPDIVIGDNLFLGPGGGDYQVGIAVEDVISNQVVVYSANVLNAGTSSLQFVFATGLWGSGQFSGGQYPSENPHIDLIPNPGTLINGMPQLNNYAVTWYNPNTDIIYAMEGGSLNSAIAISFPISSFPGISIDNTNSRIQPDLACAYDLNTNSKMAYFVYLDNDKENIYQADWNITTSNINTYSSMETAPNTNYFTAPPRIEAANVNYTNSPFTQWEAVAEFANSPVEAHGYNYRGGGVIVSNYATTTDHYNPAVCVGNGSNTYGTPTDVGNTGYTAGWNIDTKELNAIYLDINNASTVNAGYNQINSTSLGTYNFGQGHNLLALTNSSNNGEGLAAAWYNGSTISFKICGNSFAFKPTNVNALKNPLLNIYPNPATDVLHIDGMDKGSYTVTDMMGRQLLQGAIHTTKNTVDISTLAPGVYLLRVADGGTERNVRFTKE
jgi:hypothetical protein